MEVRPIHRDANRIADHKLRIIRQQELAAELARKGERERARRERAKIFQLLYQLDVLEAAAGGHFQIRQLVSA
jgi:hypothetical protein